MKLLIISQRSNNLSFNTYYYTPSLYIPNIIIANTIINGQVIKQYNPQNNNLLSFFHK